MAMVQLGENALFHFVYQKLTHREGEANDQPWDEPSSDDSSTDEDEDEVRFCCYFSLTSSHVITKQVIHRMKAACNLNPFFPWWCSSLVGVSDLQCTLVIELYYHASSFIGGQRRSCKNMLWFKFSFGAKFLKLVQFLFSFVMHSLPQSGTMAVQKTLNQG